MNYLFFICLIFMMLEGCATKPKTSETAVKQPNESASAVSKKEINLTIVSPENGETIGYESPISLDIKGANGENLDSIAIYLNGQLVASKEEKEKLTLVAPKTKVGRNLIHVDGFLSNGKKQSNSVAIYIKPTQAPKKLKFQLVKTYPHMTDSYTQGLLYVDGKMYESKGQYGQSALMEVNLSTGKPVNTIGLDARYFAEGLASYQDKLYQLTWQAGKVFVYDQKTLSLENTFQYYTQGWGLTTVGDRLLMSDGSPNLYWMDPTTFSMLSQQKVMDNKGDVHQLNELEYVDGIVWANIYLEDKIIGIDPHTGVVKYEVDCSNLLSRQEKSDLDPTDEVLNGIAYNKREDLFYITGKNWPKLFAIKILK